MHSNSRNWTDWNPDAVSSRSRKLLKDIGVKVNIKSLPSAQYWEVWTEAPFSLTAWGHRPLAIMTLGLAYRSNAAWNESHYNNPEFDRLLTQAEGILDPKERSKVMARGERFLFLSP